MGENVYKKIEVASSSTESFDKAIKNAIAKASKSLRGMSWFEVEEMRGRIHEGQIQEYQVVVKIGFTLD